METITRTLATLWSIVWEGENPYAMYMADQSMHKAPPRLRRQCPSRRPDTVSPADYADSDGIIGNKALTDIGMLLCHIDPWGVERDRRATLWFGGKPRNEFYAVAVWGIVTSWGLDSPHEHAASTNEQSRVTAWKHACRIARLCGLLTGKAPSIPEGEYYAPDHDAYTMHASCGLSQDNPESAPKRSYSLNFENQSHSKAMNSHSLAKASEFEQIRRLDKANATIGFARVGIACETAETMANAIETAADKAQRLADYASRWQMIAQNFNEDDYDVDHGMAFAPSLTDRDFEEKLTAPE